MIHLVGARPDAPLDSPLEALFASLRGAEPSRAAVIRQRAELIAAAAQPRPSASPASSWRSGLGRRAGIATASIVGPLLTISAVGAVTGQDGITAPLRAVFSAASNIGFPGSGLGGGFGEPGGPPFDSGQAPAPPGDAPSTPDQRAFESSETTSEPVGSSEASAPDSAAGASTQALSSSAAADGTSEGATTDGGGTGDGDRGPGGPPGTGIPTGDNSGDDSDDPDRGDHSVGINVPAGNAGDREDRDRDDPDPTNDPSGDDGPGDPDDLSGDDAPAGDSRSDDGGDDRSPGGDRSGTDISSDGRNPDDSDRTAPANGRPNHGNHAKVRPGP